MIIKTKRAIVNTNTYDSFYVSEDHYNHNYVLKAVNKTTEQEIVLYSTTLNDTGRETMDKFIDLIYTYINKYCTKLDLGV